jgi:uncharacterized protein (TIGR00369 family)
VTLDIDRIRAFADAAPMARWLGFSVSQSPEGFVYRLAFNEAHIGNPAIRALHGGVIASFLELAMQAEMSARADAAVETVNVAVDYLTSSRPEDMTGKVRLLREGRRIAFLEASGWQADETRLVAVARCCLKLG